MLPNWQPGMESGLPVHSSFAHVFSPDSNQEGKEWRACAERLYVSSLLFLAILTGSLIAPVDPANAQETVEGPAPAPGLSFDVARDAVQPVADGLAYVVVGLASVWTYLMDHPPAVVLLTALAATLVALRTIRNHREMTRLRETFATIDRGNWDQDVIDARQLYAEIKKDLEASKESIAKYVNGQDQKRTVTLNTILNDYENLALGVRHHIVDEVYLHRWICGSLLQDWDDLGPLVIALRHDRKNSAIYIEFEGIATAWRGNRSYYNGRRLRRSRLTVKVT